MKVLENGVVREATAKEIEESKKFNPYRGLRYAEVLKTLIEERYSLEDRLELLFNMFTNPLVAKDYLAFVKECKTKAEAIIKETEEGAE